MPASSSESGAFYLLHPLVKKWVWQQKWQQLHLIQEQAIPVILKAEQDLLIMAPTAGGKTEAAFLPICSQLARTGAAGGVRVLYVSPLKALINDQFERLEPLCEETGIPLTRWHGDAPQAAKKKLLKQPAGILQITPESLEALFINHGGLIFSLFGKLDYVVIDELHAFMGNVRGRQLQSLLCRVEAAIGRRVPRIALSATIGDASIAQRFLRHTAPDDVEIISVTGNTMDIYLQLKGYCIDSLKLTNHESPDVTDPDEVIDLAYRSICANLFKRLRGTTNLVFANRRAEVELISSRLIDLSEEQRVPNEFYPHHGSLAADQRHYVEEQLKDVKKPATAIATSTLELGIDIGKVASVAQIGAPPTVSAMRQRLGRSGRRDGKACMRIYVREQRLKGDDNLLDRLHMQLVRAIATTNLMLAKWFEPLNAELYDFSTLTQQTLSMVCEKGGARAKALWDVLCRKGAFYNIDQQLYATFLRALAQNHLIEQAPSGEILLGVQGERITSDYHFYAAFKVADEYRLVANGKTLGHLPIVEPLVPGSYLIFAGHRWLIEAVDERKKEILLLPCRGGRVPNFGGSAGLVHARIRQEMFNIYRGNNVPVYLDSTAKLQLQEARSTFSVNKLSSKRVVQDNNNALLFAWDGDTVVNTLFLQFMLAGYPNSKHDGVLLIDKAEADDVKQYLARLEKQGLAPIEKLVSMVPNLQQEKYDEYLTEELLRLDYTKKMLDIGDTKNWLKKLGRQLEDSFKQNYPV